jgi:hypothetical protein
MTFPHPRKLFLFTALSLADLGLTWFLLERSEGRGSESNPVASWWLTHFGFAGLAGFKVGIVLFVAVLALILTRRRPRAAGGVLTFGCTALLAVVVYSGFLVHDVRADGAEREEAEAVGRDLDRKAAQEQAAWALLGRLGRDLAARRTTLAEAVPTLASCERFQDPGWLRALETVHPDETLSEILAARLAAAALDAAANDPAGAEQLARDLDAQFRSCFGRPAPPFPTPRALPPTGPGFMPPLAYTHWSPRWSADGPRAGRGDWGSR